MHLECGNIRFVLPISRALVISSYYQICRRFSPIDRIKMMTTSRVQYLSDPPITTQPCRGFSPTANAFRVSFHLKLQSQSYWSLFNGIWRKRPRELDRRLRFKTEEMTPEMTL